jgi:hypothetical protein
VGAGNAIRGRRRGIVILWGSLSGRRAASWERKTANKTEDVSKRIHVARGPMQGDRRLTNEDPIKIGALFAMRYRRVVPPVLM